jgi:hypothetical protein
MVKRSIVYDPWVDAKSLSTNDSVGLDRFREAFPEDCCPFVRGRVWGNSTVRYCVNGSSCSASDYAVKSMFTACPFFVQLSKSVKVEV